MRSERSGCYLVCFACLFLFTCCQQTFIVFLKKVDFFLAVLDFHDVRCFTFSLCNIR